MSIKISGTVIGTQGGPSALNLSDLHDVSIVNPQNNQFLKFNSATAEWQNSFLNDQIFSSLSAANGVTLNQVGSLSQIGLGDITPTSVSTTGPITASNISGSSSGINTGDQTIILSGDINGTGTGPITTTLTTVNSTPQSDAFRKITVNGKGLVTATSAVSTADLTPLLDSTYVNIAGDTMTGPLTAPSFIGAFSGNADTATTADRLVAARTITASGDATWSVSFDGSSNVSNPIILATVNSTPQSDALRKITVNGKGLVTNTSAVTQADITTALTFTPVNKAGDTMAGALLLNANPTQALGAATKQYVDNVASGLNARQSCLTSTTAPLATSSGGTITYNNGTAGVGATLTTTGNFNSIGGVSTADGNRILVKDEATTANNGIYVRTSATVLTRAADFDNSPNGEVDSGAFTFISTGTLSGTNWVLATPAPITIGTTGLVFTQLSGPGSIVGGTGINVTGNTISNAGVLSVSAGTGINLSGTTGNVSITNVGVTSVAGTANQIAVSGATGAVTLSLPASVTISGSMSAGNHVGPGTGLTGTASALNIGGNAGTASALQTARTINGVSFDGTSNISISASTSAGLTMNASGSGAGAGTVFNGSAAQTISYNTIGAPSTTGANASGTWGINVTGSAGGVAWGNVSGKPGRSDWSSIAGTNGFVSGMLSWRNYNNGHIIFDASNGLNPDGGSISNANSQNAWSATFPTLMGYNGNQTYGVRVDSSRIADLANTIGGNTQDQIMMNRGAVTLANPDPGTGNGFYGLTDPSAGQSMLVFNGGQSVGPVQMRFAYTGEMWFRNQTDSANWNAWKNVITSQNIAGQTVGKANTLSQSGSGLGMVFNWSGQSGQPPWLWGGADGSNMYVYNPSNFSVNYANSSGNTNSISSAVGGNYVWTGTEQFRSNFDTSGGSSPPLQAFSDNGAGAVMAFHRGGSYAINMGLDSDNVFRIGGWSAGASRFQMDMSGNLTMAGDVTAFSDRSLKTDIVPIEDALTKVLNLTGVTFTRTDSGQRGTGLVAQDVQAIIPEAVHESVDGTLSLAYGNLVGLLVEAIKEMQAEIALLKSSRRSKK